MPNCDDYYTRKTVSTSYVVDNSQQYIISVARPVARLSEYTVRFPRGGGWFRVLHH
jgi:hypothetical protein